MLMQRSNTTFLFLTRDAQLGITPTPVQPSDDHRRGKMTPALQGPQTTPALDYKQSLNLLNCVLYVFT